ncbi:hypothetical protein MRX96_058562 [Rhipicephalus microplus]
MATGGMQNAIEPFSGKNWSSWIQRLTFYFYLTFYFVGNDTPGQMGYADIVALLQKDFDPRPSEMYSRYIFQRRDQRPEESISNYVAALRSAD